MAKKPRRSKTSSNSHKMQASRTKITPEMAVRYLEHTARNRNIRQSVVDKYARDIVNGEWKENGETIKFNRKGEVVDGQHRLWAIVEAGKPIWTLVAHDVADDAILTVDSGVPRQFHDHLSIKHDLKYSHAVAAAVRMQFYYEKVQNPTYKGGKSLVKPTHFELEHVFERHPDLATFVGEAWLKPQIISKSILGWLLYQFSKKSKVDAQQFLTDLREGAGLAADDPVHKFRNRMMVNYGAKERLDNAYIVAYAIKCWNARRDGRPMHTLRWHPSEGFPVIK